MAIFSAKGADEDEGPSNWKRQRTSSEAAEADAAEEESAEEEQEEEEGVEIDGVTEVKMVSSRRRSRRLQRLYGQGGPQSPPAMEEDEAADGGGAGASISVILTDPEVLDCPICFDHLSAPVFQCENGHIACSSCCQKLKNKCPSCCWPIGYNRCRAIEKVLDSLHTSCQYIKYGCKETLKYSEKFSHEMLCDYAPCLCPHAGCNVLASIDELSEHISCIHPDSMRQFSYDRSLQVSMNMDDRFLVLQEKHKGELFILKNRVDPLGNVVTISRMCSNSSRGELSYKITAKNGDSSLTFLSSTENTSGEIDTPSSKGFLLVPICYARDSQCLELELQLQKTQLQL